MVGNPEGKRPFNRPSYRWEDNIKMDIDWVHLLLLFLWVVIPTFWRNVLPHLQG
jgi:hypothetical protein